MSDDLNAIAAKLEQQSRDLSKLFFPNGRAAYAEALDWALALKPDPRPISRAPAPYWRNRVSEARL